MNPSAGLPPTKAMTAGIDWMIVDIHLDELHPPAGLLDHLLDDRRQLLAGAAPGRPEIDENRLLARGLDHVLGKGGRGGVLDEVGRRFRAIVDGATHLSAKRRRIGIVAHLPAPADPRPASFDAA